MFLIVKVKVFNYLSKMHYLNSVKQQDILLTVVTNTVLYINGK